MSDQTKADGDPGIDDLFAKESAPAQGKSGGKRVLLVDDSEPERMKLGAIIRQLGGQVFEAADGRQALAKVKQVEPDLIVLDVMMPNRDGLETLKILRQHQLYKDTPIVMLTVKSDAETVRKALTSQANDYIVKDSDLAAIGERLKRYL
ncbi:MAG: response regulator [Gemmatimonadetes bacterium]|jgi:adenylate cyclase|nr:response regulator [Gemmatimonadota bacterium]